MLFKVFVREAEVCYLAACQSLFDTAYCLEDELVDCVENVVEQGLLVLARVSYGERMTYKGSVAKVFGQQTVLDPLAGFHHVLQSPGLQRCDHGCYRRMFSVCLQYNDALQSRKRVRTWNHKVSAWTDLSY